MKEEMFQKDVAHYFHETTYTGIYRPYQISSDEKVIKEVVVNEDGKKTDYIHQGFELFDKNSKLTYFVPSAYLEAMPFKINKTKQIVYARKVYHLVTDITSILMPSEDTMSTKEFVDAWFPLKHTSEKDKLIAKLLVLTNATQQSWCRIITKQAFGKDGIANNLMEICNFGRKVSKVSPAKLFQLIEDKYTIFNEIAGFTGDKLHTMEDFFYQTADGNDVYEHHTTGSHITRTKIDISRYGYTIFHNIPEYYIKKGKLTFEEMFSDAIFYRIFPVELEGQIETNHQFINFNKDIKKLVNQYRNEYIKWIKKFFWLRENLRFITVPYDLSKYTFEASPEEKTPRWLDVFTKIAKTVYSYAESKEEFYEILDLIYDRHKKYLNKVKSLNLI